MGSHTNTVGTKKKLVINNRKSSPVKNRVKMLGGAISVDEFKKKTWKDQRMIIRQFLEAQGYPQSVINSVGGFKKIKNRRCSDKNDEEYIKCVLDEVAKQIINRECNNKGDTEERLAQKLQRELVSSLSGRTTTPMRPSTTSLTQVIRTQTQVRPTLGQGQWQGQGQGQGQVQGQGHGLEQGQGFASPNTARKESNIPVNEYNTDTQLLKATGAITDTAFDISTSRLDAAAKRLSDSQEKLSAAIAERTIARASNIDTSELNLKIALLEKEKSEHITQLKTLQDENKEVKALQAKNAELETKLDTTLKEIELAKRAGMNELIQQKEKELGAITAKLLELANKSEEITNKLQQELKDEKDGNKNKIAELTSELNAIKTQKATNNSEKNKQAQEMEKLKAELEKYKAEEAKRKADEEKLDTEKKEYEENKALLEADLENTSTDTNINITNLLAKDINTDQQDKDLETLINDEIPIRKFLSNVRQQGKKKLTDYEIKYILEQIIKQIGLAQELNLGNLEAYQHGGTAPGETDITQFISHLVSLYNILAKKIPPGKTSTVNFPILDDNFDGFDSQENFEEFYEKLSGITVSEKPKPIQVKPVELPSETLTSLDFADSDTTLNLYTKAKKALVLLAGIYKKLNKYYKAFSTNKPDNLAANTETYIVPEANKENVDKLIAKLNEIIMKLNEGKADSDAKIPVLDSTNLESFPKVMEKIKEGMDAENKPITPHISPQSKIKYSAAKEEHKKELLEAYQTFIKSDNQMNGQTKFLAKCKELNIDCSELSSNTKFQSDKEKIMKSQNQASILSSSNSEQKLSDVEIEKLLTDKHGLKDDVKNYFSEVDKNSDNNTIETLYNKLQEKYKLSTFKLNSINKYLRHKTEIENYNNDPNKLPGTIKELNELLQKYKHENSDGSEYNKLYDTFVKKVDDKLQQMPKQQLSADNQKLLSESEKINKPIFKLSKDDEEASRKRHENMGKREEIKQETKKTEIYPAKLELFSKQLTQLYNLQKEENFREIVAALIKEKLTETDNNLLQTKFGLKNTDPQFKLVISIGKILRENKFIIPEHQADIYTEITNTLLNRKQTESKSLKQITLTDRRDIVQEKRDQETADRHERNLINNYISEFINQNPETKNYNDSSIKNFVIQKMAYDRSKDKKKILHLDEIIKTQIAEEKTKKTGGKLITHHKSATHKKCHTHKRLQMVPQTLKLTRRHK